jgi:hypothetical protein
VYTNLDADLLDLLIDIGHHFMKLDRSSLLDFLQQCHVVGIDITELVTCELEVITCLVLLCNKSGVNLTTNKINEKISANMNLQLC